MTAESSSERRLDRARTARAPLARGSTVGRYIILDPVGRGGMGVVYAAYDPDLDRRVAIKLLHPPVGGKGDSTQSQARLTAEAKAMARLAHRNVVTAYDVGMLGNEVFVAMEFVDGKTFDVHLDAQWQAGTATWRSTLDLYIAAGRGLAAAHAAGMVHRDFKPKNVMIASDGRVLVFDFGLAKPRSTAPRLGANTGVSDSPQEPRKFSGSSTPLGNVATATGVTSGTPAYMSPEQIRGGIVGPRSDQFSFCVALFEGLHDERPFAGSTLGELRRNVLAGRRRDAIDKSDVPSWLTHIVERGLQPDPAQRHRSMEVLIEALDRSRSRPARMRRLVVFGTLVSGLLLAAGAWVGRADDKCQNTAAAMDKVWNPTRAAAVQQTFERMDNAYASKAYPLLAPIVDRYAGAWAKQRIDACRATRVLGDQSDRMMALRMACLDRRLHRLDGFVVALLSADPAGVNESIGAAHNLPALAACSDLEGLRQSVPLPEDLGVRQEVEAIRLELHQITSVGNDARVDRALAAVETLLARAERLGYPPVVGEIALVAADLHRKLGHVDQVVALVQRSVLIAEASGSDEALVNGLFLLARFEAAVLNDFDRAKELVDRARAVLQRRGDPVDQRIALLTVRGSIAAAAKEWTTAITHMNAVWALRVRVGEDQTPGAINTLNALCALLVREGRLEEAASFAELALNTGLRVLGPAHHSISDVLLVLGRLRYSQGRPREALKLYERAQRVTAANLDPDNPRAATMENGRGLAYMALGESYAALAAFDSALQAVSALRGPDHLDTANVRGNIGLLLRTMGRVPEAIEQHRRTLEINRARLGEHHVSVALAYDNLADDHLFAGNYGAAGELYERSRAIVEDLEGAQGQHLAYPLAGIGMVHTASQQYALARPVLERAVRIDTANDAPPNEAARARFALAQVLLIQGEYGQAVALASAAERGWAQSARDRWELQQVRAWLQEHAP